MKITMVGTENNENSDAIELTIEFQGDTDWLLEIGGKAFVVSDLEKAMAFLREERMEK